jgi:sugar transferase (PEP-CTERM/EpsH1 system associated)
MTPTQQERPLVLHVVYRFDTGGLENGIVNLINHMPADAYRHAVVALTEVTAFSQRIERADVSFHALHKPPGHGLRVAADFYRLLRQLRPAIVHTRNLGPLEMQLPAWLARVPARIQGEHGRDVSDVAGNNRKHQWVRRVFGRLVHRQVALSGDLADYLEQRCGIAPSQIVRACNGVDTERFHPATATAAGLPDLIPACPFDPQQHWLVGSVGRMAEVKDPLNLCQAFIQALQTQPFEAAQRLRLVLVGDGPMRARCQALLEQAGVADRAWLPGERSDIPVVMRGLHLFALPSRVEGISNTILEAMASGLPVLATRVGGNAELVVPGVTGWLVPANDPAAMAQALQEGASDPQRAAMMGFAGRQRVLAQFSLSAMVATYQTLYDSLLRPSPAHPSSPA